MLLIIVGMSGVAWFDRRRGVPSRLVTTYDAPFSCSRYLKSTIGNITLIQKFRKHSEESERIPEMEVFNFWMDYFSEGIQEEAAEATIRFPVRCSHFIALFRFTP